MGSLSLLEVLEWPRWFFLMGVRDRLWVPSVLGLLERLLPLSGLDVLDFLRPFLVALERL